MMRSLRVRLLLLLGAEIIVAAVIQFATSYSAARHEANKLFDYHMEQMASALQDSDFQEWDWYRHGVGNDDAYDFAIQVWDENGQKRYQSSVAHFPPKQDGPGFSTVALADGDWRVYALTAHGRTIQVAQNMEVRRDRATSFALKTLSPTIPTSILLLLATWGVVSTALSPLKRIGQDLTNRDAGSLAPVSERGVPKEVSGLTSELNSLLKRLSHALESQQRFVADAAHELRSPLTALRLQVQTLMRAKDEETRKDLPQATWNMGDPFTNLQDGLHLAAEMLERRPSPNQQMIVITDGQPTAYCRQGRLYCEWPLSFGGISQRAAEETLKEAERITRKGITINTFMLDDSPVLRGFVDDLTRINRGRAFYTRPDRLGQYLLIDYLSHQRKKV